MRAYHRPGEHLGNINEIAVFLYGEGALDRQVRSNRPLPIVLLVGTTYLAAGVIGVFIKAGHDWREILIALANVGALAGLNVVDSEKHDGD